VQLVLAAAHAYREYNIPNWRTRLALRDVHRELAAQRIKENKVAQKPAKAIKADSSQDIATNFDSDELKVGLDGRHRYQDLWVHKAVGVITSTLPSPEP